MTEKQDSPSMESQRGTMLNRLEAAATSGQLSLDEYGRRVGKALRATSADELAPLDDGLPALADRPTPVKRSVSWIIGVFGGSDRRGSWEPAPDVNVIDLFGGSTLDLRSATLSAATTRITAWSAFGGSTVIVPPTVRVTTSGMAIFGGNDFNLDGSQPSPNAPVIEVSFFAIFGGSEVKVMLG